MPATVRTVNSRTIEVKHKVRGRVTGTDHRTVHDGYKVVCDEHGVIGDQTIFRPLATARAASHNETEHTMEPTWDNQLVMARKLDDDELRRHASVSINNRHECRDCFTCACVAVLRERGIQ